VRVNLDLRFRDDDAANRPVDRDAPDLNVRVDFRGLADDELIGGTNRSFEFSVDPQGVFEGKLALEMAALVEKAVQNAVGRFLG